MNIFSKNLIKSEELEKRIRMICSYNYSKCEIIQGRILTLENTNISFIEPHRIIINILNYKLLVIYYDKENVFLYNRSMPIDYKKLERLLKTIKSEPTYES